MVLAVKDSLCGGAFLRVFVYSLQHCPPQEDTLMVATRMRDTAFKRVLDTMPLGSAVKIEGPSGRPRGHHLGRIRTRRGFNFLFHDRGARERIIASGFFPA